MASMGRPDQGLTWADTTFLVGLTTVPVALALFLDPAARDLSSTATFQDLVVYPLVLASGLLLYVCWRISRNPTTAWLAAGVVLTGVQGLGLPAVRQTHAAELVDYRHWMWTVDLVSTAVLISVAAAAVTRRRLPVDPFVAGTVGGVLLILARAVLLTPVRATPPDWAATLAPWLLLVGNLLMVGLLLTLTTLPRWLLIQVSISVICLGLRRALTFPTPDTSATSAVALLLGVVGAVLLTGSAMGLLRVKLRGQSEVLNLLQDRLEDLEQGARVDRERLHEIGATIAGIASASHLLHNRHVPPLRREALQQMVDTELARLQRIMEQRQPERMRPVDLDPLLEPLVLAHQAQDRVVHWVPSGARCLGRPDDISEAINILLENAAQHARGNARLEVRREPERVEVLVSDDGPGVPETMRRGLFDWGVRGGDSVGQGIGLNVAHRLAEEMGGQLRLEDRPGPGATFVISLPVHPADEGDDARAG